MSDTRRFEETLAAAVRDMRREVADLRSLVLGRLGMVTGGGGGGGVTDHGALTGLADDDHPQYVTHTEGDAAYQPLDSDLTTIAGLVPSDGQVLRRAAGAWAAHTLTASDIGAAATSHSHAAGDVTSGTLDIARLPTGTTSTTVAVGNHTHAGGGAPTISAATVTTSQSRTSNVYGDLTTVGPSVTVTIGASGVALVILASERGINATDSTPGLMGFTASGANTIAASATTGQFLSINQDAAYQTTYEVVVPLTGLAAGSTTFTAKYRVLTNASTFTWADRVLTVVVF